jgi:hypothetical protein
MVAGILAGCNKETSVKDPYVSIEMERTLFDENYEEFSGMLEEDFENKEETFNKLKELAKGNSRATFTKMEIIEYENGEMVIVYLTVIDNKIKISDVKFISPEMTDSVKDLLQRN